MSEWHVYMQVRLEVEADTEDEAIRIAGEQAELVGDMHVIAINNAQASHD